MTNKTYSLIVALILLTMPHSWAQKPEKVYSVTRMLRGNDWYKEKVEQWKAVVDKDKHDADAWLNYYTASRMVRISSGTDKPEEGEKRFERLNKIVEAMGKAVPNSFEYNYVMYYNGNDDKYMPYLLKAYEMAPDRTETYPGLVTHYEIVGDEAKKNQYFAKWYESHEAPVGLLNFAYNMLASVNNGSIIVTMGDNDTYIPWMLQSDKGIRKDISVVNIYLLLKEKAYRDRILGALGVKYDAEPSDMKKYFAGLVEAMSKNTANRPVYVFSGCANDFMEPIMDKLYLTGLCYQYSEKNIDNIALLKKNFEQNFLLDYLKVTLYRGKFADMENNLSLQYLLPIMNLYEHYKLAGDDQQAAKMQQLAETIGRNSKDKDTNDQLEKYFKNKP